MPKGRRKQFYFASQYQHVLDYVEMQPNESQYIIELVLKDMEKEEKGIDPMLLDYVNRAINARLESNVISNRIEKDHEDGIKISAREIDDFF